MSGGVKESKLAAREARTRSVTLLRMTTALPKKEVFLDTLGFTFQSQVAIIIKLHKKKGKEGKNT